MSEAGGRAGAGYPKLPVAGDDAAAKELKARTLTALNNAHPQWLADAHAALNAAVATANGWASASLRDWIRSSPNVFIAFPFGLS